jgi:long-subunit acyl-CoA synthetase (AMP-forming)
VIKGGYMEGEKMTTIKPQIPTAVEKIYEREKQIPDMVFLRQPINGEWHEYTWKKTVEMARRLVTFFHSQGLQKGDCVAIISKNCAEWIISDIAMMMSGIVSVPLYSTQHPSVINYILDKTKPKFIIIGKLDTWETQKQGVPDNIKRISFPYAVGINTDYHWNEIMQNHQPCLDQPLPDSGDIYTIVFTSGTSGNPKGVVHTFETQRAAAASIVDITANSFKIDYHIDHLSYLPLAHIFERAIEVWCIYADITVSFVERVDTFAETLHQLKPNFFVGVPRIWKVFKEKIEAKIPSRLLFVLLSIPVLSTLLKKKIQKKIGLQNAICLSGSAPLATSIVEWFNKIGITIYEGYGSTENFCAGAANTLIARKSGTVGKPFPFVELKVNKDGELLSKSGTIMKEYFKDPDATKAVLDEDGFYHTGDLAEIDSEGYVSIIGRVNDSFKSDKGEFIKPVPIEKQLYQIAELSQVCLVGQGMSQPIAIVYVSVSASRQPRDAVRKKIKDSIDSLNKKLSRYENISHVLITNDEWTIENELLTPTFKVKRFYIAGKYKNLTDRLQQLDSGVHWQDEL